MMPSKPGITIFTPSFADADNTNAQNLTVKEVVARLSPERFRVVMLHEGNPDPRLRERPNTTLLRYYKRGNTLNLLARLIASPPDIYYFPRQGLLDRGFFDCRRRLRLKTSLITYIVMLMNEATSGGLIGRSVREGDVVCANSQFVSQTVRERFGIEPVTVYDGVDQRYFYPPEAERKRERLTVLYAGSFQARKRVEVVIEQARRHPDVDFRLAGKGETLGAVETLVIRYACRNVHYLGHLTPAQLGDEMRAADLFLFPSILEGHPQVLIQATACGVPAIAMKLYAPDSIVDGKTGFLAADDQELAQRVDLLLADRTLRNAMAQAALQHARQFDWDGIAQQWSDLFLQAAAARQKTRRVQRSA